MKIWNNNRKSMWSKIKELKNTKRKKKTENSQNMTNGGHTI